MDIHNEIFRNGEPKEVIFVFFLIAVLIIVVFALLMTILFVLSFCKIFKKAGYSWAWGLLWLVPFGNVIIPLVLVFGDWPILKEMRNLKAKPPAAGSSGTTVVK